MNAPKLTPEEFRARREDALKSDPTFLASEIEKWKQLISKKRGQIRAAEKKGNDQFAAELKSLLPGIEKDLAHMRSLQQPSASPSTPPHEYEEHKPDPYAMDVLVNALRPDADVSDRYIVETAAATVIAMGLDRRPLWMVIVAPPSAGKTTIIDGTLDLPEVFHLGDVTAQAYVSGFKPDDGSDPSIATKIKEKLQVSLDLSHMLGKRSDVQVHLFDTWRDLHDGRVKLDSGSGVSIAWGGRTGLLACATPAFDRKWLVRHQMGERLLVYRMFTMDEDQIAEIDDDDEENDAQRAEARSVAWRTFRERIGKVPPYKSIAWTADRKTCAHLARIVSLARTAVEREKGHPEILVDEPVSEKSHRLRKQLCTFAVAITIARGRRSVEERDLDAVRRLAQGCIPKHRARILQALWQNGPMTQAHIEKATKTPHAMLQIPLGDLVILGICEMRGSVYTITPTWRNELRASGLFQVANEGIRMKEEKVSDGDPAIRREVEFNQGAAAAAQGIITEIAESGDGAPMPIRYRDGAEHGTLICRPTIAGARRAAELALEHIRDIEALEAARTRRSEAVAVS